MVSEEFKLVEAQRWAIGIFIILFDPAFPPLDIFSYRSTQECGKGHIYKVIRAALLIVAKNWKSPKCPSTGGDFNKLGNVHTLDCHTLVKLCSKMGPSQTFYICKRKRQGAKQCV